MRSVWTFDWFGRSIGAPRAFESMMKVLAWVFLALFLRGLFRSVRAALGILLVLAVVHVSFLFNVVHSTFLSSLNPDDVAEAFLRHRSLWEKFQFLILPARDVLTYSFLWIFLGVRAFLAGEEEENRWVFRGRLFLFTFIPVLALGYSLDRGLYLTLACAVVFLALHSLYQGRGLMQGEFVLWTGLGLACGLYTLGWLLDGNWAGFFKFTFLTLPAYKELSEKIPFPLGEFKFLAACLLLSAHLFRLALGGLKSRGEGNKKWLKDYARGHLVELVLAFMSVLFFGNVLARSDEEHLFYGMGPLLILTLYSVIKATQGWKFWDTPFLPALKNGFALWTVLVGLLCLARGYRADILEKNFPIRVPDSAYVPPDDAEALGFLQGNMKKGDLFFTLTSEAIWYYYLGLPCPTRFPYVWVAAPRPFQKEIVRDLDAKKVKWVLFKDEDWSYRVDGIPNDEKFPVISDFIRGHYRFFKTVAGHEFWVLKGS